MLAAICAAYAFVASIGLTSPFLRHQETVPARYAAYARNFARLGIWETRFGMVRVNSPDMSVFGDWRDFYYPQRPSIAPIALSLWTRIFGESEASIRLNLIALGVATILMFHAVAARLLGCGTGLAAAILFALAPMYLYFSLIAVHYAYALFFALLAWWAALRESEGPRFRVLLFAAVAAGCFTDWPAYYAAGSLALHFWRGRRSAMSYALAGTAVACFGLNLLHRWWLDPQTGRYVLSLLSVGAHHAGVAGISPVQYLLGEAREIGVYFTVGGAVAAAWGAVVCVRRRFWPPLFFALWGLEEVMFVRQAHGHDYLTFSAAPFFALAGAVGLKDLASLPRFRAAAAGLALLAAAQAAWIAGDRLTRTGGNEPAWQAAVAIRQRTAPQDRTLLVMDNSLIEYYSDRYVASVVYGELALAPEGKVPARDASDFVRYLEGGDRGFHWVVVGASERAAEHIGFFRDRRISGGALEAFWFFPEDHPLRRLLGHRALREELAGPFVFYRLRE